MSQGIITAAYLVSAVLFILALAGLSKQESAKMGNIYGAIGMVIALVATIFMVVGGFSQRDIIPEGLESQTYLSIAIAMAIGGLIGLRLALKVEMTEMPELVAILHSFVGLAAVFVGYNSYLDHAELSGAMLNIHLTEIYLGIYIGAITFTGSVIAFGKLRGILKSKPLT
ncbi:MAG: NAD(P)(+) transhydrogenase (Re/Si-specific) subunit beta, partial [Gammaproteobacteria bacterium]